MLLLLASSKPQANLKVDGAKLKKKIACFAIHAQHP